ncbi:GDSL-type esterase/lipase family protein [Joostella sp.]|uniref:GDSL-type esterase/lipase family protein n=1 Tax=Joostella sp. TaxID=2231138 RepID=UPI003A8D349F
MGSRTLYTTIVLFFFVIIVCQAKNIKIACIGDSVTYGLGLENREKDSYPSLLQNLLGTEYNVRNFGVSGATMLRNGHKPYWESFEYKESLEFNPDIVIIHLGLNDQGNNNWPSLKNEFEGDYLKMISIYRNLPSKPLIFICKMSPTLSGHHWFEEGMRENYQEVQASIIQVAKKTDIKIIDLHEQLYRYPDFYIDDLHPTKEGTKVIAKHVYEIITGDFGGLKLPVLYGENMVLQRDESITFTGKANYKEKIWIEFANEKKFTKADYLGNWKIEFDAKEAGGPYSLNFVTRNKSVKFKRVFVGEVWLASGQSNMEFPLSQMERGSSVLKDSLVENIFLYSLDGKVLSNKEFDKNQLESCSVDSYFDFSGWSPSIAESSNDFSAIAYSFAYNLQKKLKVPVGIICNAIGGSPIQSWVSRKSMEQDHETISLLNDIHLNPLVDSWVAKRIELNMKNIDQVGVKSRHPYQPTFLFDSGIIPLIDYNIKGVIWYQGESNTEHPELYSKLFGMLVEDWRNSFKNLQLPFYYVQLSSMNRPKWGEFRNVQRKLLNIKYTGMAVSYDHGNATNVHPKEKWVIGNRLSKIALNKNYSFNMAYSGPLFDYININGNKLEVHFKYGDGLKTIDNQFLKDVYIAASDKVFVPIESFNIVDDTLLVWSSIIENPRYIRFGCTSNSDANLINQYNLPASSFSN